MTERMGLEEYQKEIRKGQGRVRGNPKKVHFDGFTFDSQVEADIYYEYKVDPEFDILEVHPEFLLQPGFTRHGKKYRKIIWTADIKVKDRKTNFIYVIEVKSKGTLKANSKSHSMRRKMFLYKYPNYSIREIIIDGKKWIQTDYL